MTEASTSQSPSTGTTTHWRSAELLVLSYLLESCFAELFYSKELGRVVSEASFVDDAICALSDGFDEVILIDDACSVLGEDRGT